MFTRIILILHMLLILTLFTLPAPAQAHKALFFAYMEGGELVGEGGFPGGKFCKGCPVIVFDAATGVELVRGNTDENGLWRTALPKDAAKAVHGLKIILKGGEGHQAEWLLEPEEYLDELAAIKPAPETKAVATPVREPVAEPAAAIDLEALQVMVEQSVEQALDKKLGPIKRQLAKALDPGPTLASIMGGLGWIVGLAGIFAWFRSKRF